MTAINFPDTPEVGDTFSVGQITWEWTGSVWKGFTDTSANVTVSTTPPDDTGSIWFNNENGITYIYYDNYWTSIASSSGSPIISDTAPTSPIAGLQWFNSTNGKTYIYFSNAWIEVDSNGNSASSGGNVIINGGMDIWQRGTSFQSQAGLAAAFTADRHHFYRDTGNIGATLSRQASTLGGFNYVARVQRDSGNTSTTGINLRHTVETANSIDLAGKTITFSFYARAGANYSAASQALNVIVATGTGVDQAIYSFSGYSVIVDSLATLTSSWQRFTYTAPVSEAAKEIGVQIKTTPVGTAGANDWYEITGLQLETGTVATPFKRNTPNIQAELAACQRYYYRSSNSTSYGFHGLGSFQNTTTGLLYVTFPVTMRTFPSAIEFANLTSFSYSEVQFTFTSMNLDSAVRSSNSARCQFFTTGATAGQGLIVVNNNNTAGFLAFSAEL